MLRRPFARYRAAPIKKNLPAALRLAAKRLANLATHRRRPAARPTTIRRRLRPLVALHESLEPRLVLATGIVPRVDLAAFEACADAGFVARGAVSMPQGDGALDPASGTVTINPNEPGEPGVGANLGKPEQPPLTPPVSNGVGGAGQQDAPPQVAFISPADGTQVVAGGTLLFEVEATDDIGISRVEFYRDGTLVSLDSAAPYARDLMVPAEPGTYVYEALAYDTGGQTATASLSVESLASEPPPPIEANLWVQFADPPDSAAVGDQLTYTVDLFSDGPSDAENVVVTLAIPQNTTFTSSLVTMGTYAASAGRWILGTLPPGMQTLTLTLQVDAGAAAIGKVRALPLVTSTTDDPDPFNNIAMANTAIVDPPAGNVPPTITSLAIEPASIIEGQPAQLTGTFSDPDPLDTFLLHVDWNGDGAFEETLPVAGGAFAFGNLFRDDPDGPDAYDIRVELEDGRGGVATGQVPFRVANAPPLVAAGPDETVPAGETFLREITFADAGQDAPWIATIDWGDGTPTDTVMAFAESFAISHVFAEVGGSTVTISVDDGDGGIGQAAFEITHPAPASAAAAASATSGPPLPIDGKGGRGVGAQAENGPPRNWPAEEPADPRALAFEAFPPAAR